MLRSFKTLAKFGPSGFQAATMGSNFATIKPYVVDPFDYNDLKDLSVEQARNHVKDWFTQENFVQDMKKLSKTGDLGVVAQREFPFRVWDHEKQTYIENGTLVLRPELLNAMREGAELAAQILKKETGVDFVISTGGVYEFTNEEGGKFVSNTNILAGAEGSIAVDKRFLADQDVYKQKLGERVDNDPHAMLAIFVQEMDGSFTKVNLASQTCLDLNKKQAPYDGNSLRLVIISPTFGAPLPDYWTPRLMTVVADEREYKSGVYLWKDGKIERIGSSSNAIWWDYCFRMIASIATLDPMRFLEYVARDKTVEISKKIADGRSYLDLGRFEIPLTMPDSKIVCEQFFKEHPEYLGNDLAKTEGIDKRGEDAHPETEGDTTGDATGTGEGEHGRGSHPDHPEGHRGRGK